MRSAVRAQWLRPRHGSTTPTVVTGAHTRHWRTLAAVVASSFSSPYADWCGCGVVGQSSPLTEARRLQRTTPTRVRTSSWKGKAARFDRLQEEQAEAEAAAHRRARAASTADHAHSRTRRLTAGRLQSSFWRPKHRTSAAHTEGTDDDRLDGTSHDTGDRAAMPRQGVWYFLRGGKRGRFKAPLNPLHALKRPADDAATRHNADARATQRLLHVVDELRLRSKKNRKDPITVQLSDEQRKEIVNKYADTRWYGKLYRPFRNVTEKQLKWTRRLSIFGMLVVSCLAFACCFYIYCEEMKTIMALSEEDRRDYVYMVNGMRYSDIFFFAQELLKKEDPLHALPPAARYHVVVEACREKGWHTMDWAVEQRKRHPKSALEDMDLAHMLYWASMLSGNLVTGGGAIFSPERMDELLHISAREKAREDAGRFVEAGPSTAPENTRRTFF